MRYLCVPYPGRSDFCRGKKDMGSLLCTASLVRAVHIIKVRQAVMSLHRTLLDGNNRRVHRSGLSVRRWVGKQKDLGSILLRLSSPFKSSGLWTLSFDFVPHNE